jgi:N-methylhydantoinase B
VLSAGYSRNRRPVWGSAGGEPGGRNGIAVTRARGDVKGYAFVSGLELEPGDTITVTTANGGGWGRRATNG